MPHVARNKYVEVIHDLQERGFSNEFVLRGNRLFCPQQQMVLHPSEFYILEMHFLPTCFSLRTERMLYAITNKAIPVKGILEIVGAGNIIRCFDLMSRGRQKAAY